jgi:two-component system, sensor histidine kinase
MCFMPACVVAPRATVRCCTDDVDWRITRSIDVYRADCALLHDDHDEECSWRTLAFDLAGLLARLPSEAVEGRRQLDDGLVGVIVHELKTPVAIIRAYAELLEAHQLNQHSRPAAREIMTHIVQQAELMAGWVDTMLDVDRLKHADLPLELARFDLVQLVWSIAAEVQQTTGRHQIRVVARNVPRAPVVADHKRLRQALTNLLENALKYAPNGIIEVRLGTRSEHVFVAVQDHGPGLDASDLDTIFRPFKRLAERPERNRCSLGLGLFLARQIARLHGGELWAESRGRGQGSTFVLALPWTDR